MHLQDDEGAKRVVTHGATSLGWLGILTRQGHKPVTVLMGWLTILAWELNHEARDAESENGSTGRGSQGIP